MDVQQPQPPASRSHGILKRRTLLKFGLGALGASGVTLQTLNALAAPPQRVDLASKPLTLPEIQFDISAYLPPAKTLNGVLFRFGPVYTLFVTMQLRRTPGRAEQAILEGALRTLEERYQFDPRGLFTCVSYGLPYFKRLPVGIVASHQPRLLSDPTRLALEEAVPGPTDISALNPQISKRLFNVPVQIEANDLLLTLRSDHLDHLYDAANWLSGSGDLHGRAMVSPDFRELLHVTSQRLMFVQPGLPRRFADARRLDYAGRINSHSPMWMGFADQQVAGSGPALGTTFQGNTSARLTNANAASYFANGAIQHLSHVILDLEQFYASDEPYTERCQYMFRSTPIPSEGYHDQYLNGGGPTALENTYQGTADASRNAQGIDTYHGERRMGHLSALQRSSRASDGTPLHIRADGPGFDPLDVPGGFGQPKLQFSIFLPTSDFFATMRTNQASLDLVEQYQVKDEDNGLERFLTATRRQNYLVPPRRHRAFPLLELV